MAAVTPVAFGDADFIDPLKQIRPSDAAGGSLDAIGRADLRHTVYYVSFTDASTLITRIPGIVAVALASTSAITLNAGAHLTDRSNGTITFNVQTATQTGLLHIWDKGGGFPSPGAIGGTATIAAKGATGYLDPDAAYLWPASQATGSELVPHLTSNPFDSTQFRHVVRWLEQSDGSGIDDTDTWTHGHTEPVMHVAIQHVGAATTGITGYLTPSNNSSITFQTQTGGDMNAYVHLWVPA